ncbi:uncharacterized protein [Anoplolepis gracilipes]|uniref:uncharacterized protein isoform X2 n=1 Tax=Anoplolepis gracilipes TaxID=354296 RepID=UPI003B9FF891
MATSDRVTARKAPTGIACVFDLALQVLCSIDQSEEGNFGAKNTTRAFAARPFSSFARDRPIVRKQRFSAVIIFADVTITVRTLRMTWTSSYKYHLMPFIATSTIYCTAMSSCKKSAG